MEDRQATKNKITSTIASNLSSPVYSLSSDNLAIPPDLLSKVWIVPAHAKVYENGSTAYVVEAKLKVMLEDEYFKENRKEKIDDRQATKNKTTSSAASNLSSPIYRLSSFTKQIIIPAIEKEVNEGAHFAQLRQIYSAMVLATWYKQRMKESLLGQIFVNKNKTKGFDTSDKQITRKIYDQYLESFKKGVANYIKEEYDPLKQEMVSRKYFTGGEDYAQLNETTAIVPISQISDQDKAVLSQTNNSLVVVSLHELNVSLKGANQVVREQVIHPEMVEELWRRIQEIDRRLSISRAAMNGEKVAITNIFEELLRIINFDKKNLTTGKDQKNQLTLLKRAKIAAFYVILNAGSDKIHRVEIRTFIKSLTLDHRCFKVSKVLYMAYPFCSGLTWVNPG
ncbi:MAG: hypothetical protein HQL26_04835 [Candidatus Omnitrophica bacterium]|nr:hypothetical protein [Candidatus Omnitrophota bacterium]